eukprot:NODE_8850_length_392_cov_21.367347_g7963_i0.p1 GENE.NODE_8850_length_392_cov_21.367347_g7963_i0~~NODE_8850_length_392_cov_21.367347_g7963_i0.p1  ORF type:complete len:115 (+),score=46.40 NODE_8850_length_392_cov_21.367347_g7963_i0:24-347(+)
MGDQVEVSNDPSNFKFLNTSNVPVIVTLLRVGSVYVADPSLEEESCMTSRLTVAVDGKGRVCGVRKSGKSGMHPTDVLDMLNAAKSIAMRLIKRVDAIVDAHDDMKM